MKKYINAYHDERDNDLIKKHEDQGYTFIGRDQDDDLIFEKI